MNIKEISAPIEQYLKEYNDYFKSMLKTNVALLDLIIKYVTRKKGKQVRPIMVFLSAEICGGVNPRAYVGAAMVELLHTATLIHDDVVDEADERRGIATINVSWNNKIAVLIGDFLLAKGLLASTGNNEMDFLHSTSTAVKRMSEGELLQIQSSSLFNIDEETYFRIVADKTASLISACCEIGAISANADKERQMIMREFGELIGIGFQIKDDIFDYNGNSSILGKPVGNDLKEKKITLPLIFAISQADKSEGKEILKMIKKGDLTTKKIKEIYSFVSKYKGIEYAEQKAKECIDKANFILGEFPDSSEKESLMKFANYFINRSL